MESVGLQLHTVKRVKVDQRGTEEPAPILPSFFSCFLQALWAEVFWVCMGVHVYLFSLASPCWPWITLGPIRNCCQRRILSTLCSIRVLLHSCFGDKDDISINNCLVPRRMHILVTDGVFASEVPKQQGNDHIIQSICFALRFVHLSAFGFIKHIRRAQSFFPCGRWWHGLVGGLVGSLYISCSPRKHNGLLEHQWLSFGCPEALARY